MFYYLNNLNNNDPITLIINNYQTKSLHIILENGKLRTVRIPALHELVTTDLPHLHR